MPFIGRQQELDAIRRELGRARPSLLVIIGRRRVGKSTLISEALHGRPSVYYQATKIAGSENLALFKAELAQVSGADPVLEALGDWHGLLSYIAQTIVPRIPGLTVVLDEFPYLCEADPALPSVVQKVWDAVRRRRDPLNLVLCGSKISFMDELLAEKNPLHGRQTLKLDVGPLSYRDAARFFPRWSDTDRLRAYGVFGGVPYYLSLCDPEASLGENIGDLALARGAPLADEPTTLLQAELRDVGQYATILRAIASGCTDSRAIIGRVREIRDASTLAPYIRKLAELRLIRIVRSLGQPERERDRRYAIDDPFLAFWYRFYLPNSSALAAGHAARVYRDGIAPLLDEYMGGLFEWICRDYVRLYGQERLPTAAQEVGQIWAPDFDLDVAGKLLDGAYVYGECKWSNRPAGSSVLEHLMRCARQVTYGETAARRHHLLFAKAGFTAELQRRAAADATVHLLGPAELLHGAGV